MTKVRFQNQVPRSIRNAQKAFKTFRPDFEYPAERSHVAWTASFDLGIGDVDVFLREQLSQCLRPHGYQRPWRILSRHVEYCGSYNIEHGVDIQDKTLAIFSHVNHGQAGLCATLTVYHRRKDYLHAVADALAESAERIAYR